MRSDEQAIRDLLANWQRASAAGDLPQLLSLMDEDVVFLTPEQPPMRGRDAFATAFRQAVQHVRIEASSEIQELRTAGDWAYCWTRLTVTLTPLKGGSPVRRSGYALTIFRRQPDGNWVLTRDANLLTEEPPEAA